MGDRLRPPARTDPGGPAVVSDDGSAPAAGFGGTVGQAVRGRLAEVDRVTIDGVPAVHFHATDTGLAAYAAACSLDDMRKAELWIAEEGGHLMAVDIVGRSRGETGWFVTRIEVSDINDPKIEVERPV